MIDIEKLSKQIKEEIRDADKYANCALMKKDTDRILADTYYTLATQELQHMELLHQQVVRLINDYKAKKGDPPRDMQIKYDYIHEEEIEATKEVKILLAMYKG